MTHQEFINTWTGRLVPSRGGITGQCVSLVQKYAEDVYGVGGTPVFPVGAAKDMLGTRTDAFISIPNSPTVAPKRGDIVVMNGRVGGGYGHTGVVTDADLNKIFMFQQNDPIGSGGHIKEYNYNNVTGWLTPKTSSGGQPTGGDIMQGGENEYNRANDLHRRLRGRDLGRDVFNALKGQSWLKIIEIFSDDPEAENWQANANTGAIARKDNWEFQINTLTKKLDEQKKIYDTQIADLQKQIEALKKQQPANDDESVSKFKQLRDWIKSLLGIK